MKKFLNKALKGETYTKTPLTKEGSERKYFRIKTKSNTYVLSHSSVEQKKLFLKTHKIFSKMGLNVPRIFFVQDDFNDAPPSKDEASIADKTCKNILQEDLSNQSLEKEVQESKSFPLAYYKKALDQIIKLQSFSQLDSKRFLNKLPSSDRASPGLFTTDLTGSEKKFEGFLNEMLFTEKHLIKGFFKLKLDHSLRKNYLRELKNISQKLKSFPHRLSHRDLHSRNIFIKDQKIFLIDFQDTGFFPRFYDLASLLYDPYVAEHLRDEIRKKLFHYFLLHIAEEKGHVAEEKGHVAEEELLITALQRLFKATGNFASFYILRKKKSHLKYIPPALKQIEHLLKKQDQYPFFLELIQKLLRTKKSGVNKSLF